MPFIEVKYAGELSREQREKIVAQMTQTMKDVAGKPESTVLVHIQESSRDQWGKAGELLG